MNIDATNVIETFNNLSKLSSYMELEKGVICSVDFKELDTFIDGELMAKANAKGISTGSEIALFGADGSVILNSSNAGYFLYKEFFCPIIKLNKRQFKRFKKRMYRFSRKFNAVQETLFVLEKEQQRRTFLHNIVCSH